MASSYLCCHSGTRLFQSLDMDHRDQCGTLFCTCVCHIQVPCCIRFHNEEWDPSNLFLVLLSRFEVGICHKDMFQYLFVLHILHRGLDGMVLCTCDCHMQVFCHKFACIQMYEVHHQHQQKQAWNSFELVRLCHKSNVAWFAWCNFGKLHYDMHWGMYECHSLMAYHKLHYMILVRMFQNTRLEKFACHNDKVPIELHGMVGNYLGGK